MTKGEAKRRVYRQLAVLLSEGVIDNNGLTKEDRELMRIATKQVREELVSKGRKWKQEEVTK
jgi:hypothetical protein